MKRNAGWMLLAALCVLLCACRAQGSAVPAVAAGRYSGESVCIYGGERTPMDEVYSGESYLELREDGRGTLCLGGDEAEFRWQLDGTALTLTSGRETCRGTLENGRIIIICVSGKPMRCSSKRRRKEKHKAALYRYRYRAVFFV